MGALQALTQKETEKITDLSNYELEASFHTLRRLLASKVGFGAFTNLPGYIRLFVIRSNGFMTLNLNLIAVFVNQSERKWWLRCIEKIWLSHMLQSIC